MATKVVEAFDSNEIELHVREMKFGDKLIVLRYEEQGSRCFGSIFHLRVVEVERLTEFPRPSSTIGEQEMLCYYRATYIDKIERQEPIKFALDWWEVK